jgi:hypothetical protein
MLATVANGRRKKKEPPSGGFFMPCNQKNNRRATSFLLHLHPGQQPGFFVPA